MSINMQYESFMHMTYIRTWSVALPLTPVGEHN